MSKEIHLRVSKELFDSLEKEKYNRNYDDKQDMIRDILEKELNKSNSFWQRLKELF